MDEEDLDETSYEAQQVFVDMSNISRKKEMALLDFYGLENLQPQVWTDVDVLASPVALLSPNTLSFMDNTKRQPTSVHVATGESKFKQEWAYDDSDPLGIKESVFGRKHKRNTGFNKKTRNAIIISSRDFDPKTFLVEVHKNTSYEDLQLGYKRLQEAVEKRKEVMKQLVKENFDRFVGAKSTVEAIYMELKSKNLNSAGYGTENFTKALDESTQHANTIFKPVVDRKVKAEKIRSALAVLDRYKFFFNLPSTLQDAIETEGKYDQAVRDYKKGKSIYFGQLASSKSEEQSQAAPKNITNGLIPVFEKVWMEVERIIVVLRKRLFKELTDMITSIEIQERNIIYLIELDSKEDPVLFYINCQHKWIMGLLNEEQMDFETKLDSLAFEFFESLDINQRQHYQNTGLQQNNETDDFTLTSKQQQRQQYLDSLKFRKSIHALASNEYPVLFRHDVEVRAWDLHLLFVKNLSEILNSCLPDFWKLCRSYMERKYQTKADNDHGKGSANDQQVSDACHKMLNEILEKFCAKVDNVFEFVLGTAAASKDQLISITISPVTVNSSAAGSQAVTTPVSANGTISSPNQNVSEPPQTRTIFLGNIKENTLAASQFLPQIVTELANCLVECQTLIRLPPAPLSLSDSSSGNMSNRKAAGVSYLVLLGKNLERMKEGFTELLCSNWIKESSSFYCHEDWTLDTEYRERTSVLRLYHLFQKIVIRSLFQIINMVDLNGSTQTKVKRSPLNSAQLERIRSAFFDSLYSFLDGLHFLAFHPNAWSHWTLTLRLIKAKDDTGFDLLDGITVDPSKSDCRVLLMLINLLTFNKSILPELLMIYQDVFQPLIEPEKDSLTDTISRLDQLLFEAYIKRKSTKVYEFMHDGILFSGQDWRSNSPPAEVSGYVNEVLLYLVLVHAEITSIMGACSSAASLNGGKTNLSVQDTLIQRVFASLVHHILQNFLDSYRQVDSFGEKGGAVKALLDVHAIQEVLHVYVESVPESQGLLKLIETTVCKNQSEKDEQIFQTLLDGWLKSCEMEFQCFADL